MADAIVTVAVSLATRPKPQEELQGLVWGMAEGVDERPSRRDRVWWRNPKLPGAGALGLIVILNIIFI